MKEWKIEKRRRLERCVLRGDILLAIDRDGLCITYALELKGGKPKTSSSPFCYPNVLVGPLNKFRMTGRRIPTAFMLRCDVYMPRRSSSRPTMLLKFAAFLFFNCYNIRPMFNTCIYRVNVTLRKSCRLYMHRTVTVSQKRSSILEHIRDLIIGWDYVATFFPMQLTT